LRHNHLSDINQTARTCPKLILYSSRLLYSSGFQPGVAISRGVVNHLWKGR